jgi:hypothetical protein
MPPQQTSPEQAIMEQMQELALEIYARLAVAHLSADHYTEPLSRAPKSDRQSQSDRSTSIF